MADNNNRRNHGQTLLAGAGLGLPGAGGIAADGEVLLAVAARVGRTRLIDNALIDLG